MGGQIGSQIALRFSRARKIQLIGRLQVLLLATPKVSARPFSRARKSQNLLCARHCLSRHFIEHLIQMRRELQNVQIYTLN